MGCDKSAVDSIGAGWATEGCVACVSVEDVEGAHAANSAMSRLRVRKRRGFIFIISFREVISGISYGKINASTPATGRGFFVSAQDLPAPTRGYSSL
jgi:hypothetical protein